MSKLNENVQMPVETPTDLAKVLYSLFQSIARKVNGLSDGKISAFDDIRTSVPASGSWAQGDFVKKSNPVEAGGAGTKYCIIGWQRLTSGTGNVLNTDWVEVRFLTGN